jgi:hypothetical protein
MIQIIIRRRKHNNKKYSMLICLHKTHFNITQARALTHTHTHTLKLFNKKKDRNDLIYFISFLIFF